VLVDGVDTVTPQTFSGANWAIYTTHTLSVSASAQALSGTNYVFGRWSDNGAAAHAITLTPRSGYGMAATTAPSTTVYSANFVQLVNFSASVYPAASGGVAASPAALSYPGASGAYYVARQPVTLTATPAPGYGFVDWGTSGPPYISAPWSANPKVEPGPGNVIAYFTQRPITTIVTSPPGLAVTVDGNFWYTPQNFSSDYFPSWTPGSSHAVAGLSPQLPYSINSRYLFASWSDGGLQSHNYVVPATNATLSAAMTPQFVPIGYATPTCAATVSLSPSSPGGDGFYSSGTSVSFNAAPAGGFAFIGWRGDLTGLANPQNLVVNDEELASANYDATATPLAITSFNPPFAFLGSSVTVAVNGTGFTPATLAYVNTYYRASQYVSPTQINVSLTAADLVGAALPIAVGNFPPGATCGTYVAKPFFVASP
jgi:hypothetical protein